MAQSDDRGHTVAMAREHEWAEIQRYLVRQFGDDDRAAWQRWLDTSLTEGGTTPRVLLLLHRPDLVLRLMAAGVS